MPMLRVRSTGGDGVDVEIENLHQDRLERSEAGLFESLAESHGEHVGIAIGVTSGLEPSVQLPMMGEEHAGPGAIDDPSRSGDVPLGEMTLETPLAPGHEIAEAVDDRRLSGMAGGVAFEQVEKGLAMHGGGRYHRFAPGSSDAFVLDRRPLPA